MLMKTSVSIGACAPVQADIGMRGFGLILCIAPRCGGDSSLARRPVPPLHCARGIIRVTWQRWERMTALTQFFSTEMPVILIAVHLGVTTRGGGIVEHEYELKEPPTGLQRWQRSP